MSRRCFCLMTCIMPMFCTLQAKLGQARPDYSGWFRAGLGQAQLCLGPGGRFSANAHLYNGHTNKLVGFYGPIAPQFAGSVVRICGMMRMQHFWIRTSLSSTAAALHATIGGRMPESVSYTHLTLPTILRV